jgi:uncharacterized protein DUF6766
MSRARAFVHDNGLSLFFGALFLAALFGQAVAGQDGFNEEQRQHGSEEIGFWRYVTSAQFAAAVLENWQSEYLQFTLFILVTVWFVQRGSPESKQLGKEGLESEKDQKLGEHAEDDSPRWARVGGVRTFLYSNSLLIVMGLIWVGSWVAQAISGWTEFTDERLEHQRDSLSFWEYLGSSDFWERTLQNWQSEFLAVGSMAILAVYLRQRGSPESKPVGAPHDATSVEG